jgi:hypothetical protein
MNRIALALALLAPIAAVAQTPADIKAVYDARATADVASQKIVLANAANIEAVRALLVAQDERIAALESTVAANQAAVLAAIQQVQAATTPEQVRAALLTLLTPQVKP